MCYTSDEQLSLKQLKNIYLDNPDLVPEKKWAGRMSETEVKK